jgi:hypothetical protein
MRTNHLSIDDMQTATPKIQTLTYKLIARNFIFTVRPEVSSIASTNHFTIHTAFTIVITCFFTALLTAIIALDYNIDSRLNASIPHVPRTHTTFNDVK